MEQAYWAGPNGNLQFTSMTLGFTFYNGKPVLWLFYINYNMMFEEKTQRQHRCCQCLVSFLFNHKNKVNVASRPNVSNETCVPGGINDFLND